MELNIRCDKAYSTFEPLLENFRAQLVAWTNFATDLEQYSLGSEICRGSAWFRNCSSVVYTEEFALPRCALYPDMRFVTTIVQYATTSRHVDQSLTPPKYATMQQYYPYYRSPGIRTLLEIRRAVCHMLPVD